MAIRVGVNGFGRIGRVFFRTALEAKEQCPDLRLVVNAGAQPAGVTP